MVRRLIKKEDVRLCEKKLSKGYPGLLPAGEGICMPAEICVLKSKSFQNPCNFTFVCISVVVFKSGHKSVVGVHTPAELISVQLLHFKLDCADLLFHGDQFGLCGLYFFIDGAASCHILMLRQITQCLPFCEDHTAFVRRKFACDHF